MERQRHTGTTRAPRTARTTAASLSFAAMGTLLDKLPAYSRYTSHAQAVTAERLFRRAMGARLKECGDRLLGIVEKKSQIMSSEMEQVVDVLVERIGDIFRRLDREGKVTLIGGSVRTIAEIEQIDSRLVQIIEESLVLVHNLGADVPATAWFKSDAPRLARGLGEFNKLTEERNYLLGLGWESEFRRSKGRTT
ncbi:hypothetical protein FJ250_07180 [bacterium]|nr:hypothetical protein [bacterium]